MHDIKLIRKDPDFFSKKLLDRNSEIDLKYLLDLANLAKLYSAGRLPLDIFISNRRPLSELELAFNDLEKGVGLRTLIVWPNK